MAPANWQQRRYGEAVEEQHPDPITRVKLPSPINSQGPVFNPIKLEPTCIWLFLWEDNNKHRLILNSHTDHYLARSRKRMSMRQHHWWRKGLNKPASYLSIRVLTSWEAT